MVEQDDMKASFAKAAAIFKAQMAGDKTALMAAMMGSMKGGGGIKPKIHR